MMQTNQAISGLAIFFSLSGALACSDSGGTGSGVASSKTLGAVTDADAVKICQWSEEQGGALEFTTRQECTLDALSLGGATTAAACNTYVDACVKAVAQEKPAPADTESDDCSKSTASEVPSACDTLTVGEYEKCVQDIISDQKKALAQITCSNAGSSTFGEGTGKLPASCAVIANKCPDLIPSESSGDGGATVTGTGGTGTGTTTGGTTTTGKAFTCPEGTKLLAIDVCDDIDDCDNGEDEQNCP